MPAVRIATSTQGLILGVADAMIMHAAGARKAIDWHTFRTWPNSPKMKAIQKTSKKRAILPALIYIHKSSENMWS